jgi:hypothetical protein
MTNKLSFLSAKRVQNKFGPALLISACIALTGCVVTSVYPFYKKGDLAFEQALLGDWAKVSDGGERWKFQPDETNSYRVTYTSGGNSSVMNGHYFKLGEQGFLDLVAAEIKEDIQPPPIPAHHLLRIYQLTPTLKLGSLKYGWLSDFLSKSPETLRHMLIPDGDNSDKSRLVLTAEPEDLQQFVAMHLDDAEAWEEAFELAPAPVSEVSPPEESK